MVLTVIHETMNIPEDVVFRLGKGGKRGVKGGGKCWGACLNKRRGGGGAKVKGKSGGVRAAFKKAADKIKHPEGRTTRKEKKIFREIDAGKRSSANFKGAAAKYAKHRQGG